VYSLLHKCRDQRPSSSRPAAVRCIPGLGSAGRVAAVFWCRVPVPTPPAAGLAHLASHYGHRSRPAAERRLRIPRRVDQERSYPPELEFRDSTGHHGTRSEKHHPRGGCHARRGIAGTAGKYSNPKAQQRSPATCTDQRPAPTTRIDRHATHTEVGRS
jgi:hypothetical protein